MADRIQSSLFRYHLLINSFKIEVFDPKLRLCSEIKTGLGFLAIVQQFINQLFQVVNLHQFLVVVHQFIKGMGTETGRRVGDGGRRGGYSSSSIQADA
jgi:hypothetical protein